jgi:serine/threonine protein kinase
MMYQLLEVIGFGRFAQIWKAYRLLDGVLVAVKVFHQFVPQTLRQEVSSLYSQAHNPFVIKLIDNNPSIANPPLEWDSICPVQGFVMELCEEGSIASWVSSRRSPMQLVYMLRNVLVGLSLFHSEGGVHCDIRPDNLFLTHGSTKIGNLGSAWFPWFRPYGIYRPTGGDVAEQEYKAPELKQDESRELDWCCDIYSLGKVLLALLPVEPITEMETHLHQLGCWMANEDPLLRPMAEDCLISLGPLLYRVSSYNDFIENSMRRTTRSMSGFADSQAPNPRPQAQPAKDRRT